MSEQNQPSGQNQDPEGQDPKTDTVKYETYQKVLNEKKKRDEELRLAREALSKHENERKELEEKALREKEDFKKLFESRDLELKAEKEKREEMELRINNGRKYSAFCETIGMRIEEKFSPLLELEKITIDPTTGKPDEATVKAYADEFKKNYPVLFQKPGGRVPNSAGFGDKTGLTYEQWLTLPYAEQRKRQKELID